MMGSNESLFGLPMPEKVRPYQFQCCKKQSLDTPKIQNNNEIVWNNSHKRVWEIQIMETDTPKTERVAKVGRSKTDRIVDVAYPKALQRL